MVGLPGSEPGLIVHRADPLNAEPPLDRLVARFHTGAEDFYVRSHGAMPAIDAETHVIRVKGRVRDELALSVADLRRRFGQRTVTAVMQCAGNRRADLQRVAHTSGDPWASGAIGNARWTGVALRDVLQAAGAAADDGLHVVFRALDIAENDGAEDAPYEVSIPMRKAQTEDVLLAWAMNGEPLAQRHGAPLRVVVPGYAGVRSPKWLAEILVQDAPSQAFQQAHDYRLLPPDVRASDTARGEVIYEMPLNAAICVPTSGDTVPAGPTTVRGYALSTDRAITRVDVSADDGTTWRQATLEDHGNERWSWTLWRVAVELSAGEHTIVVRAWDAAGQTQPARAEDVWNCKGYLSAAWHRVGVHAA